MASVVAPQRILLALMFLTVGLSGCTSDEGYVPDEATTNTDNVHRVLVRGFLDPMGYGQGDEVFRVRIGAVNMAQEGVPFDGYAIVTLEPGSQSDAVWLPRSWDRPIDEDRFNDDTGLPYYEFTADGQFLEKGEPLLLTVKVELDDGRILTAQRETYA